MKTYAIFSEDSSKDQNLSMAFFAVEVDPVYDRNLISFIKHQDVPDQYGMDFAQ